MPIHYVTGDLLVNKYHADSIGHGINLQGVMGAGIAQQLALRYPTLAAAHTKLCFSNPRTLNPGDCWLWTPPETKGLHIFNLVTQEFYGRRGRARPEWVNAALITMRQQCDTTQIRSVALPRLAAGLGGLEWSLVREIIEAILGDWDGEVYVYDNYKAGE